MISLEQISKNWNHWIKYLDTSKFYISGQIAESYADWYTNLQFHQQCMRVLHTLPYSMCSPYFWYFPIRYDGVAHLLHLLTILDFCICEVPGNACLFPSFHLIACSNAINPLYVICWNLSFNLMLHVNLWSIMQPILLVFLLIFIALVHAEKGPPHPDYENN